MLNVTTLSTDAVPEEQKSAYWSDVLRNLFEGVDVEPLRTTSAYGRMDFLTLSRLTLCRVEGSGARVAMPFHPRGSEAGIRVLSQRDGVSHFEQDGQKVELRPGDCLVHDLARPHVITSPGPCKVSMTIIPTDLAQSRGMTSTKDGPRKAMIGSTTQLAAILLENIWREAENLPAEAAPGVANSLLNLLATSFDHDLEPRAFLARHATVMRARKFIESNLRDPDMDIDQVAAAAGCTPRYLQLLFCAEGTTVSRSIWRSRLEHCRYELETTSPEELSITEIAFAWGFSSSSHFSRRFKEHFGFSPSQLRRAVYAGLAQPCVGCGTSSTRTTSPGLKTIALSRS